MGRGSFGEGIWGGGEHPEKTPPRILGRSKNSRFFTKSSVFHRDLGLGTINKGNLGWGGGHRDNLGRGGVGTHEPVAAAGFSFY